MSTSQHIQARFPPGTVIEDRYEIIRHLGDGGFASVFLAKQRLIDREVAIKILHSRGDEQGGATFEDRFLLEAKVAAKISHPNVVTIYDFGFTGTEREPFLVMEYLAGHELEDELGEHGRMPPERALPLFVAALDALGEGHDAGVVHKDLKPANLFLTHPDTDREQLKVLDFGVARLVGSNMKLTSTGHVLGTPQYMAPEYIEHHTVTPALDVYQMGLILVEALTGQCVVTAPSSYQCCVAHCTGNLNVNRSLLEGALGPSLRKALARKHGDRHVDARAFADSLREVDASAVWPEGDMPPSAPHAAELPTGTLPLSRPAGELAAPEATAPRGYTPTEVNERPEPPSAVVPSPVLALGASETGPLGVDLQAVETVPDDLETMRTGISVMAVAVIVLLLTGGAAILVVTFGGSNEPVAVADAGVEAPAPLGEQGAEPDVAAPLDKPEVAVETRPTPPTEEPVEPRAIDVVTQPPGASLYRGDTKLGVTPLAVPAPSATTKFRVSLPGYTATAFALTPDSPALPTIVLVRKTTKRPNRTTAKPKPKRRPDAGTLPAATPTKPTKPAEGFGFAD